MDDEDLRALIAVLEARLIEIGEFELADESRYVMSPSEGEENRLLPPRERLVGMLEAFDRLLAIQDRATYQDAMERLATHISGDAPRGAVVIPIADEDERSASNLAGSPPLRGIRVSVGLLIEQLTADGMDPPPAESD